MNSFRVCFDCCRKKPDTIKNVQTLEITNEAALLQPEWQVFSLDFIVLINNIFSKKGLRKVKVAENIASEGNF